MRAGVVLAGGGYVGVRVRRLLGVWAEKRWPSYVRGGLDVVTMRILRVSAKWTRYNPSQLFCWSTYFAPIARMIEASSRSSWGPWGA